MKNKLSTSPGFTLVELIVVIVMIGIVAGFVATNAIGEIQRGRDAKRIATLRQLANALENYYNDNNAYPSTGGAWYSSEPGDVAGNNNGNWIPGLAPTYISRLPKDPTGGASTLCQWKKAYIYQSDGQNYALLAHCSMEATTWDEKFGFYDPNRPTWAWKVCQGTSGCSY